MIQKYFATLEILAIDIHTIFSLAERVQNSQIKIALTKTKSDEKSCSENL